MTRENTNNYKSASYNIDKDVLEKFNILAEELCYNKSAWIQTKMEEFIEKYSKFKSKNLK